MAEWNVCRERVPALCRRSGVNREHCALGILQDRETPAVWYGCGRLDDLPAERFGLPGCFVDISGPDVRQPAWWRARRRSIAGEDHQTAHRPPAADEHRVRLLEGGRLRLQLRDLRVEADGRLRIGGHQLVPDKLPLHAVAHVVFSYVAIQAQRSPRTSTDQHLICMFLGGRSTKKTTRICSGKV